MLLLLTKYSVRNYNHDIEIHINNRVHSSLNLYTIQRIMNDHDLFFSFSSSAHFLAISTLWNSSRTFFFSSLFVYTTSLSNEVEDRLDRSILWAFVFMWVKNNESELKALLSTFLYSILFHIRYETNSYKWLAMIDSYSSFLVFLKWYFISPSEYYLLGLVRLIQLSMTRSVWIIFIYSLAYRYMYIKKIRSPNPLFISIQQYAILLFLFMN